MTNPIALFINCVDTGPSRVEPLTLLKDFSNLTPGTSEWGSNSQSFNWSIENKYYSATIDVVAVPAPLLPGVNNPTLQENLSSSVEALVLAFRSGSASSFNLATHWRPFCDAIGPSVRILVCEKCEDNHIPSRRSIIEWCVDNAFELVELDSEEDDEEEDENEPFASGEYGVPRILAALNAHTWSNLEMKDFKPQAAGNSYRFPEEMAQGVETEKLEEASTAKDATSDERLKEIFENFNLTNDEGGIDDEEESFDQLFNKMAHLKNQSQNLPFEERRAFAEKVTMAFWRAIGGDEDELEGLDDGLWLVYRSNTCLRHLPALETGGWSPVYMMVIDKSSF